MVQCPVCGRQHAADVEVCPIDGARLLALDPLTVNRVGAVLGGRYHVRGVLGQGGMGTVFTAIQQPIGRKVAVKVLHPDLAKDKTFVTRFHTEAKAASVLVNPNTVTIHDFGQTEDGTLYIAMEHLEGVSLADRLDVGPLPWTHAAAIGAQVCRALAEAHRKGIVHRDLKPENIMLLGADDGSLLVKVLDFGIAKMLQAPGRTMTGLPVTQVGVIIGTPQYMSPEQAQGKEPSAASDLYALGVILYEALAGEPPFDNDEYILLLGMHIQSKPPPLASPLGDFPETFRSLVMGMLEKEAKVRPGPADHVGSALRQLIGGQTPSATEVLDLVAPAAPPAPSLAQGRADAAEGGRPPARRATPPAVPSSSGPPPAPAPSGEHRAAVGDEDQTRLVASPEGEADLELTDADLEQVGPQQDETALLSVVVESVSAEAAGLRPDQVLPDHVLAAGEDDEFEQELTPVVVRRRPRRTALYVLAAVLVVLAGSATGVLLWASRDRGGSGPGSAALASVGPASLRVDAGVGSGQGSPDRAGEPAPAAVADSGAALPQGSPDAGERPTAPARAADAGTRASEPVMATVAVNSRPEGVQVYDGSELLCSTPCKRSLTAGRRVTLTFKRRGLRSRERSIVPGRDLELVVDMRSGGASKSGNGPREPDPFGLWER